MSNRKVSQFERFESIYDGFDEVEKTDKELDEELIMEGMQPDKIAKEGLERFNMMRTELKLENAATKKAIIAKAKEQLSLYTRDLKNPREALMQLFGGHKEALSFFSKIESIDDQDALDMLDDATLLDIIEKINKDAKE